LGKLFLLSLSVVVLLAGVLLIIIGDDESGLDPIAWLILPPTVIYVADTPWYK
jgi:hypothetical protein